MRALQKRTSTPRVRARGVEAWGAPSSLTGAPAPPPRIADAAQVDIDSLVEHRAALVAEAASLGVSDEAELLALLPPAGAE